MLASLQPALDILDEGLRIYRRGFVGFTLITATWIAPIAVGVGLSFAAGVLMGTVASVLLLIGWMLLALPLFVYLLGGLSRAARAVQQERPILIREAMAIPPLRALGMSFFTVVFSAIANVVVGTVSCVLFCGFYFVLFFAISGIMPMVRGGGDIGEGIAVLVGVIMVVLVVLAYGASLLIGGMSYSALIYGLQSFALEDLRFGAAFQRSMDLILYRLKQNLLAFMLSSAISSALSLSVTLAVATLLPLPLFWALGENSPVVQGVSVSAWVLGLIVVLPPLPIWMMLLYQRNQAAREGRDLAERIRLLPLTTDDSQPTIGDTQA